MQGAKVELTLIPHVRCRVTCCRPGFPHLREEWEKELKDDPTDSSTAPPSVEPEGGSDAFEDYY